MTELKRVRSPNYPAISLPAAIQAANKLSGKMRRNAGPREAIAKILGYNGLNGASMGAISALVKYGLLEKSGEDLKLSERAMALIAAKTTGEHTEAMFAAARAPVLFAELVEEYNGTLPDDEILRSYLKRKGFADSALPQVIQSFRETMELVTEETGGYSGLEKLKVNGMPGADQHDHSKTPSPPIPLKPGAEEQEFLRSPLSAQSTVRIWIAGPAGPKEIDNLIKLLKVQRELMQEGEDV